MEQLVDRFSSETSFRFILVIMDEHKENAAGTEHAVHFSDEKLLLLSLETFGHPGVENKIELVVMEWKGGRLGRYYFDPRPGLLHPLLGKFNFPGIDAHEGDAVVRLGEEQGVDTIIVAQVKGLPDRSKLPGDNFDEIFVRPELSRGVVL
jgi:hypothetical protein